MVGNQRYATQGPQEGGNGGRWQGVEVAEHPFQFEQHRD